MLKGKSQYLRSNLGIMSSAVRPIFRRLFASSSLAYVESIREPLARSSSPSVNTLDINSRLKQLVKAGRLYDARNMFEEMLYRDEVSWTNMIVGYVHASFPSEALALFHRMRVESGLQVDQFLLSLALKACGLDMNVKCGMSLHGYSIKSDFMESVFVGCALLDMYMKTGETFMGCDVFDQMPVRNVVTWTAVITGLVRGGFNEKGLVYFSEMLKEGIPYDSFAFAIALKACTEIGFVNSGREIHCQAVKKGLDSVPYLANCLTTLYNKCGKISYGLCLFERMRNQDVVSWTNIISTYVQTAQEHQAIEAFLKMRGSDVIPNEYTLAAVISACANLARIDWGEQLHAHALQRGFGECLSVANSLMAMYSKCDLRDAASTLFHEMNTRDIVSWSTIIGGYAQGGYVEEAFELLSRMRIAGTRPTEFALSSVLSACGSIAILDQGKQLHAYVVVVGLDQTTLVQSALINMYSKSGSISEAMKLVNWAGNIDIVTFTALINGYAEHGYSHEAIDLFEKIIEAGLRPDSVTFIGVLTACSHAGLVDLGYYYFDLMKTKYGLSASKEHYGCMVDLLCRAGCLSDAEHMIKSMPFRSDDVIWSTLLRASKLHGDINLGRRAVEQIVALNPNCAAAHIILASIYSSAGKWREATNVRKLMISKGVTKEPGWSWIKVKNQLFTFMSWDRSHAHAEEIYCILQLLSSNMGYSVDDVVSLAYDL